ncbi:MAG: hypothetical protein EON58_01260 [Alphaproteobacteria bacterium]|nr:MAG: hypothetical protein EON58_01260 [Alphaproteobacteria bacterium]
MPRRRFVSKIQLTAEPSSTVVVLDHTLAEILGIGFHEPIDSSSINGYLSLQSSKLARLPAWLTALRNWVLVARPTVISLSPDTVLDCVLFNDFITAQSYGIGVPSHVPALLKPNGSLNWLRFDSKSTSTSARGLYAMGKTGLFCFSSSTSRPFALPPQASIATTALEDHSRVFKSTRDEARRRLQSASHVLLLGINPSTLQDSDTDLLNDINPTKRLTFVTPKASLGKQLMAKCCLSDDMEIQLESIDRWIPDQLHQWATHL